MSNLGDRLPIDLGCSYEEEEDAISHAFWVASEKVRLLRTYNEVGEQLGRAVGALIDAEADGLAETHDTNVYGFAFHRREPLVRPDFYLDEDE